MMQPMRHDTIACRLTKMKPLVLFVPAKPMIEAAKNGRDAALRRSRPRAADETASYGGTIAFSVAPLNAARTAQRAVPTNLRHYRVFRKTINGAVASSAVALALLLSPTAPAQTTGVPRSVPDEVAATGWLSAGAMPAPEWDGKTLLFRG